MNELPTVPTTDETPDAPIDSSGNSSGVNSLGGNPSGGNSSGDPSGPAPRSRSSNRGAARRGQPSPLRRVAAFLGEILHVVVISLAIILPVRYFLIQPFYVKGASMEPNFLDHEYLIIDELSYRFHPPQRGDIVVFRYPNDPSQYFIKRVIGLPGERVRIENGSIRIYDTDHPDGQPLDETSYLGSLRTSGDKDVRLGSDQYYLLGDNRPNSLDSRIFGPVPSSYLIGRVWIRGWPLDRAKLFTAETEIKGDVAQ